MDGEKSACAVGEERRDDKLDQVNQNVMKLLFLLFIPAAYCAKPAAKPTIKQCEAFSRFTHKWNPLPETLSAWVKDNCDRIQPRPVDMTCKDVQDFVDSCNFSADGPRPRQETKSAPPETLGVPYEKLAAEYFRQSLGKNRAGVLPQYMYVNPQTAQDFGQFGNRYWPNFYPWAYVNDPAGPEVPFTLQADRAFNKGGYYQYNRADNIINTALQQTSLPLCLHDLWYCIRARYFNPTPVVSPPDQPGRKQKKDAGSFFKRQ